MKKRSIFALIVAGLCGLFFGLDQGILSFPFGHIAQGLSHLSQKGGLGNGLAMVLYVGFCLWPLYYFLFKRRDYGFIGLGLLVSGAMFYFIYRLMNPSNGQGFGLETMAYQVSSILWSLTILYGVLIIVGQVREEAYSNRYFSLVLLALALVVFYLIGAYLRILFTFTNYGQVLVGLSSIIPLALSLPTLYISYRVHGEVSRDLFSGQALAWVKKLASWSSLSLVLMASSQVLFNILNFYWWDRLGETHGHISFPFTSIIITCLAFILSKKLQLVGQVKDENDLFI